MSAVLRDFVRLAQERLDDEILLRVGQNGDGAASSWEDYRYRCGRINGLREARDSLDETLRLLLDDSED